ncbi:hypothetical protein niasHT_035055 [Heterodera trifolii]|uniref:Uncharacterized protein n=1 Tax=Heterodera trifolii TaxID=157864 RepID=A0ABD2IVQ3_9BILA
MSLSVASLLALLVLLAISSHPTFASPISSRDLNDAAGAGELQAVEKRRNAEFINGLLTMERFNAVGKRSPTRASSDDGVVPMLWRPQHPFFWTE